MSESAGLNLYDLRLLHRLNHGVNAREVVAAITINHWTLSNVR